MEEVTGVAEKIVLKGRRSWGRAEGEALVSGDILSWYSDVDLETGLWVNRRDDMYGKDVKDRILVFRGMKGGTGSMWRIPNLVKRGLGPLAIVNSITNQCVVAGAYLAGIPVVDQLDKDPLTVIETGDWVVVDGEKGTVEVTKKR